jgi:hypothetical protein
MGDSTRRWTLSNFIDGLDRWIALENPDDDLRVHVTAWVLTRSDDPYQGVRREPGFDNLWYGAIPGSIHPPSSLVVCSYWIEEAHHSVRCESFATLSMPI